MTSPPILARPGGLRADSARNRAQLLECARRVLADEHELPPLNALAQLAGVGVGTVYRHFATPRILLESVAADALAELLEQLTAIATMPDSTAAFEAMIRTTLDAQARDPGLAAVLASPTFECADVEQLASEFVAVVTQLLNRARRDGALRADISADDLRRLVTGVHVAGSGLPPEQRALYAVVLLAGLRAPGLR